MSHSFEQLTSALAGRYAIERELARADMATIYLARDLKHDRQVAIKVLPPEVAAALGGERFLREIDIAGRLQHPNILMMLDWGEADGLLYYVMPYAEGESLAGRLEREGQLPFEDALQIGREVASALTYAHTQGVIHRDIKPANIMLTGGHAMVMAFGIGKELEAGAEGLTETGMIVGTPAYMSPEQGLGERDIDGRTDVYALGSVLYEMLVGEPPYTGPTAQAILAKRVSDPIPSARRIRETIPVEVDAAIEKSLAQDPNDRFATAEEFATAIAPGSTLGDTPSSQAVRPLPTVHRPLFTALIAVTVIIAAIVGLRSLAGGGVPDRITLAVLPFQTVGVAEDEFFAEGMTVELADRLGRLEGVSVVGRSGEVGASFGDMTPTEIGDAIGAEYILSGTIRWATASDGISRVRINPQLVRSADEERVWGEPYDGSLTDVFTLQADVAERVAEALNITLVAGEEGELRRAPTENLAAWQEYSLGRRFFAMVEGATAIEHYRKAIELDPNFALAYAGLADAYHFAIPPSTGGKLEQKKENWARGEQAARRALALDSTLGPAYISLGSIFMFRDLDWDRAEENMKRGLALDPDYAQGHNRYRNLLNATGRHDSALAEASRAVALDPLNPLFVSTLGTSLVIAGSAQEAIPQFDRALEIDPAYFFARYNKSGAYLVLRDWDSYVEEFSGLPQPPGLLDLYHAALVDRDEAAAFVAYLDQLPQPAIAALSSLLGFMLPVIGENQRAIDMIEMAVADRAGNSIVAIDYPTLAPLKDEPRFQELRREMGLP